MGYSLIAVDRPTHVRIIAVAVVAAIVFVTVLVAAQVGDPSGNMMAAMAANAPPVVKAEKATTWTSRETTGAVR
jgi:hypothetical protein